MRSYLGSNDCQEESGRKEKKSGRPQAGGVMRDTKELLQAGLEITSKYTKETHPSSVQWETWKYCIACGVNEPQHYATCKVHIWQEEVKKYLEREAADE